MNESSIRVLEGVGEGEEEAGICALKECPHND